MLLTLIRHGESEGNIQKRYGGHYEFKLTEEGRRQAEKIALNLSKEKYDHIYVSDLIRTRETAEPIIRYHPNTQVTYDPRLREKHLGIYEGKKEEEYNIDKWGDIEGGESQENLKKRIIDFLDYLWEKHKGESILVISHGGYITTMLMHLANNDDKKKYHPGNASVSIVRFDLKRNHEIILVGRK
ncbi:MAG: histidine phosphatase family protein [Candidatus Woesearchaeota archaeon]